MRTSGRLLRSTMGAQTVRMELIQMGRTRRRGHRSAVGAAGIMRHFINLPRVLGGVAHTDTADGR